MTLGDLLRKLREVGDQFNSYEVPLIDENWEEWELDVETIQNMSGTYFIKMTRK